MKNKENTTSILDNIRKKMQKIEEKKVSENIELGDEFEYIDKATKQSDAKKIASEIINDSKNQAAASDNKEFVNAAADGNEIFAPDLSEEEGAKKAPDVKHNFLYENKEEVHNAEPEVTESAPQASKSSLDDLDLELENEEEHSDLDLGELDDLEEDQQEDDLDLDDLDLEKEIAPATPNVAPPQAPPAAAPANKEEDLDLTEEDHLEEEPLELEEPEETLEEDNDDLNLDSDADSDSDLSSPAAPESSPTVVDNVYAATANEIISEIKPTTDNQKSNMISGTVVEKAASSINKLIEQVTPKKPEAPYNPPKAGGSKTVEDLVMEILQPQLEQWLNTNLPGIVERVVSEEIKKIIPKQ
jgi:hypothetical protein